MTDFARARRELCSVGNLIDDHLDDWINKFDRENPEATAQGTEIIREAARGFIEAEGDDRPRLPTMSYDVARAARNAAYSLSLHMVRQSFDHIHRRLDGSLGNIEDIPTFMKVMAFVETLSFECSNQMINQ